MNIGWIIVITICFIFIQSRMYEKWGFANIYYSRSFNRTAVFEGEEIEMIDEISNRKLLPLPWLRLESKMNANFLFQNQDDKGAQVENEVFHRTIFSLFPYQKITRKHFLTCTKRGYYQLDTVSMSIGDPFGFSEKFQSMEAKTSVAVYPRLVPIEEIPLPSHSFLGEIFVKRWIVEDPFVNAGIRDYQNGDSLQTINWKATARAGRFQVNKKDFTADHHLLIYVNFDQTEDIWLPIENPAFIERAISYAASIAEYSLRNGVSTGFGCNGYLVPPYSNPTDKRKASVRIEPSNGENQLEFILDTMAKISMDRSRNFNYFLLEDINRQIQNHDILILTSRKTEQMVRHIYELEGLGNSVEVVLLEEMDVEELGERYA
ncbi:DUF58 domain-containing protein [Aquibacillus salsiterrae]|uniref:DUF58 domain-containing protein n=1 Tax=Aquibacillus salsiterrae TaxID=2950439 RepID=A0A9X4AH51_9BACI|nr:DUF58 domain-containing protein [Aquibacillus salsiterrae]MDC3417970.1 DUF58 domain-containing protein [Aquibacillus salsiterrae]